MFLWLLRFLVSYQAGNPKGLDTPNNRRVVFVGDTPKPVASFLDGKNGKSSKKAWHIVSLRRDRVSFYGLQPPPPPPPPPKKKQQTKKKTKQKKKKKKHDARMLGGVSGPWKVLANHKMSRWFCLLLFDFTVATRCENYKIRHAFLSIFTVYRQKCGFQGFFFCRNPVQTSHLGFESMEVSH